MVCSSAIGAAQAPADTGRQVFVGRCAGCHGSDGNGGELGPGMTTRLPSRTDQELTTLVAQGLPAAGMPPFSSMSDSETADLIRYLRTLKPPNGSGPLRTSVMLAGGRALAGLVLNQSTDDLQLLGDDRKIHLLRKSGRQYRVVTSQADWPSYNGETNGSRYSALGQINKSTVGRLTPRWIFSLPNTSRLQVTPVVVEGVMYVTSANECYALDAGSGREVWHYQRARTKGLVGNAAGGVNRGVGVAGDRVFMVTDHAHLIALDRSTGALLWETEMADWHQNYNATGAPLWATGLTPEGRPIKAPNMEPSLQGTRVCPSLDGASNWYSASLSATTGLYYVQTNDKCGIFTRTPMEWEAGKGFMGGSFRQAPDEPARRILRAIDIHTGKAVWELPQTGAVNSWGGTLSTAGGVVIFGEDSGALMAADAANGKPLWSFQTSQLWKASPMTYMFDHKQYVAVAAGSNIIAFGLSE